LRVRAREPRLKAVLYPASGSGLGPASRPSSRSSTPISRALPAQTSHEHVDPWVVNNHTKFICLRGSSDDASQFISTTAIQLTPSLPSYTTYHLSTDDLVVVWHSGRTSVSGRRTFPVLRSTCSCWVTTNVGKPSAIGQPTKPTQPFILSGSINCVVSWNQMSAAVYR